MRAPPSGTRDTAAASGWECSLEARTSSSLPRSRPPWCIRTRAPSSISSPASIFERGRGRVSKHDSEVVQLAGQHVLELFSNADLPLIYHGYKRSRALVADARDIAKGNELNGVEGQVLLLSAWFHDAGYVATKDGGPAKSIVLARSFLESQNQSQDLADAVAACVGDAGDEQVDQGLAADVLHDALLAPMASRGYLEESELLRLEEEQRTGKIYSDVEWTQSRIEYLQQHAYRTRWAQLEYEGGRAK